MPYRAAAQPNAGQARSPRKRETSFKRYVDPAAYAINPNVLAFATAWVRRSTPSLLWMRRA